MLNHVIREAICKHFSWQWGNSNSCALPLQNVSEIFEVGVAATDDRMTKLEGWNIGAGVDFVGSVHVSRGGAVGLRVLHLAGKSAYAELEVPSSGRDQAMGKDGGSPETEWKTSVLRSRESSLVGRISPRRSAGGIQVRLAWLLGGGVTRAG